jgi:hypothetical protein
VVGFAFGETLIGVIAAVLYAVDLAIVGPIRPNATLIQGAGKSTATLALAS